MMEKTGKLVIVNSDNFKEFISHIENNNVIAFDTETTGLKYPIEKVIGFSVSGEWGVAYYLPHLTWNKELEALQTVFDFDTCVKVLNMLKDKQLLTWNGVFDVKMVKAYFGVDLRYAVFADGQLMKHTLMEDSKLALKTTAIEMQEQLGLDMEKEANHEQLELKNNVALNGGSTTADNYEMYKADLEVMGKYAARDADLTFRICHLLRDKLEEEGLEEFFYDKEVMPLFLVSLQMEEMPVKLDIPLIEKTRKEIEKDIAEVKEKIIQELESLPEVQEWIDNTARIKFPEKMSGSFVNLLSRVFPDDAMEFSESSGKISTSKKAIDKLPDCKFKRVFLGQEQLDPEVSLAISRELWRMDNDGNYINISSKPQMAEICFKFLGEKPLSETTGGKDKFDETFIKSIAGKYEWARLLSDYNKLNKIKSTYIERFLDNQIDGNYYFYFKQSGTISGRYSSDAQQLPRPKEESEMSPLVLRYNNLVRSFFISGEGRKFVDIDYEALEPRTFAHVSNDENIMAIFEKGHDFYSTIAIIAEKLVGVSADKKADNFLGKVNKPKRQAAKAYSLGLAYGLGIYALSKSLNVSEEEAQKIYDGYFSGFPNLKKWYDSSKEMAKTLGYVKTEAGRVRHLPKVKFLHEIHGDQLMDNSYRSKLKYKLMNKMSKDEAEAYVKALYMDYKNGINNALNFQIQGLAASVVNQSMININKYFRKNNIDAWICATIHDQIICNVPEDRAEELSLVVERIMCESLPLRVKLKAPPAIAKNWKDGH